MNPLSRFLIGTASTASFTARAFALCFVPPYYPREVARHIDELGSRSVPLVAITGTIIGLILTLQTRPTLARFGAESFIPGMVGVSIVRELGPVITALIVAGRVASGIGAELGSMRVTEQIDAMELSPVDPFRYLAVTRVLACIILLPLLTALVDAIALGGAYFGAWIELGMSWRFFSDALLNALDLPDVVPSLAKTAVFGLIIGAVGSHQGFHATGGTQGVGRAATSAVVIASLLVLVSDAILVKVSLLLWG